MTDESVEKNRSQADPQPVWTGDMESPAASGVELSRGVPHPREQSRRRQDRAYSSTQLNRAIDTAYERGYAAAIRDMQDRLLNLAEARSVQ